MEEEQVVYRLIPRHDTSTNWTINNPILAYGEYGVEDDTHRIKRGNGQTHWVDLQYEVLGSTSWEDLKGDVLDNEQLRDALDTKLNTNIFETSNNKTVADIQVIETTEDLLQVLKSTTDIETGELQNKKIIIKSSDNSVQAKWTTDEEGNKVLSLTSESTIDSFKPNFYYAQGSICLYKGVLHIAKQDFTSGTTFDSEDWEQLSVGESEDISYDNTKSQLQADNVQDALDEINESVQDVEQVVQWAEYD